MKKILFVLSVLAMMVVGCKNPTVPTETPVEETPTVEAPKDGGDTPETPPSNPPSNPPAPAPTPEDKSPYEYVKPACVNLADYTYVGDYIFADTMNFAEWKYSNSQTDYLLAFEKIARVKNDNPDTRIVRCEHNTPDVEIPVIKATKYKIYIKTSVVDATNINDNCFNNYRGNVDDNYDGSVFRVEKLSSNTFEIVCRYETYSEVMNNYVAY